MLLAGVAVALVVAVWLLWGFDRATSDDAKYRKMQTEFLLWTELDHVRDRLPRGLQNASPVIHGEALPLARFESLQRQLLASGYLTNATFEITGSLDLFQLQASLGFGTNNRGAFDHLMKLSISDNLKLICRTQDIALIRGTFN